MKWKISPLLQSCQVSLMVLGTSL